MWWSFMSILIKMWMLSCMLLLIPLYIWCLGRAHDVVCFLCSCFSRPLGIVLLHQEEPFGTIQNFYPVLLPLLLVWIRKYTRKARKGELISLVDSMNGPSMAWPQSSTLYYEFHISTQKDTWILFGPFVLNKWYLIFLPPPLPNACVFVPLVQSVTNS